MTRRGMLSPRGLGFFHELRDNTIQSDHCLCICRAGLFSEAPAWCEKIRGYRNCWVFTAELNPAVRCTRIEKKWNRAVREKARFKWRPDTGITTIRSWNYCWIGKNGQRYLRRSWRSRKGKSLSTKSKFQKEKDQVKWCGWWVGRRPGGNRGTEEAQGEKDYHTRFICLK